MAGRDGAEARKERLQRIARTIQTTLHKEGEIQLTKTVAVLQYEMGLTGEKSREYLEVLRDLGHFVLDFEHDKIKKVIEEEPSDTNQ
jgi:hypothetical protein